MTKLDLDELEFKARHATLSKWCVQGPWPHATIYVDDDAIHSDAVHPTHIATSPIILRSDQDVLQDADMVHIAANSPPVTLALIARIRELEAALGSVIDSGVTDGRHWSRVLDARPVLARGTVLP